MRDVFEPSNAVNKPKDSRFFLGETVLHTGDRKFYTVCSLENYEQDYFGLWPLGVISSIPLYGSHGKHLESIAEPITMLD